MIKIKEYYEDMGEIIQDYLSSIMVWNEIDPSRFREVEIPFLYNQGISDRILVNILVQKVLSLTESLKKIREPYQSAIIDSIKNQIDTTGIFKELKFTPNNTEKNKLVIIRNAFAHAHFKLGTCTEHPEKGTIIIFSHPEINGKIKTNDIVEYNRIIETAINQYRKSQNITPQRTYNNIEGILNKKIKMKATLLKELSEVTITSSTAMQTNTRKLTNHEIRIFYYYITYIGLDQWNKISSDKKTMIIYNLIDNIIVNREQSSHVLNYVFSHIHIKQQSINFTETTKYMELFYEKPIAYTSNLLNLCFLVFNFLEEVKKKDPVPNFNYFDLKTTCNINYPENRSEIIRERKASEILRTLLDEERKIIGYRKTNGKKLRGLLAKPQDKLTKEDINNIEYLKNKDEEYNKSINTIKIRRKYIEKKSIVYDAQKFINHLRNSITHGYYSIDYIPGLESKKMQNIVFHFEDYEIDNETKQQKKVFDCKITGKNLTILIEQLSTKFSTKFIHNISTKVTIGANTQNLSKTPEEQTSLSTKKNINNKRI